jgi:hypothetical protein
MVMCAQSRRKNSSISIDNNGAGGERNWDHYAKTIHHVIRMKIHQLGNRNKTNRTSLLLKQLRDKNCSNKERGDQEEESNEAVTIQRTRICILYPQNRKQLAKME